MSTTTTTPDTIATPATIVAPFTVDTTRPADDRGFSISPDDVRAIRSADAMIPAAVASAFRSTMDAYRALGDLIAAQTARMVKPSVRRVATLCDVPQSRANRANLIATTTTPADVLAYMAACDERDADRPAVKYGNVTDVLSWVANGRTFATPDAGEDVDAGDDAGDVAEPAGEDSPTTDRDRVAAILAILGAIESPAALVDIERAVGERLAPFRGEIAAA